MTNADPMRYRDAAGAWHTVSARPALDGGWEVIDSGPDGPLLVETLTGIGEGREAAEALARDYATYQAAA